MKSSYEHKKKKVIHIPLIYKTDFNICISV